MKYFIDTEFYEYQPYHRVVGNEWHRAEGANAIQLISIGIVAEDGREFYAENADFDWGVVPEDHWLQDNVRPHLWGREYEWYRFTDRSQNVGRVWPAARIADEIRSFVIPSGLRDGQEAKPEFYGWYCDYDWVVFCGLFGRMIDLPKSFPMYMRDLKQAAAMIGNPDLSEVKVEGPAHHALTDARDVCAKFLVLDHVYAGFARP